VEGSGKNRPLYDEKHGLFCTGICLKYGVEAKIVFRLKKQDFG
jgi:hypothetical protein